MSSSPPLSEVALMVSEDLERLQGSMDDLLEHPSLAKLLPPDLQETPGLTVTIKGHPDTVREELHGMVARSILHDLMEALGKDVKTLSLDHRKAVNAAAEAMKARGWKP